jgi:tetratricopeptide (TPR) repeat protein
MKKAALFLVTALLFCVPGLICAQVETGGVDNVFSYGAGLRALGMGGAFTAMKHDPTLAYWNPGAMAFNQYREISVFGTRSIASSYYVAGFYTNPTINVGTLSAGILGVYTDGIESYDENASPISGAKTSYLHYQILLSYGYNFNKWGLGVGGSAKIEQMRITDYKGSGASFDLGVFYNPPKLPWFSAGAVVQDVYGTGIKLAEEFEPNTRIYKAGIAGVFPVGSSGASQLAIALDSRFYRDNYNSGTRQLLYDLSLGTELAFSDQFMFRLGYRNFTPADMFQNLPAGLSVGAGFRWRGLGIDYAVSFSDPDWQGPLELLMRVGVSYRFGISIDERKKQMAEEIRKQIDTGIRKATEKFEGQLQELRAEYDNEKQQLIDEIDRKYEEKISSLDASLEESKQEIARLSVQQQVDKTAAINELTKKYESEKSTLEQQLNAQRATYETRIGDLQRRYEEASSLQSKRIADEAFKSERYAKGLQLYSDGDYEEALAEFEAVARFDPNYLRVQEYINRTKAEMRDVRTYSPEVLALYYNGIDLFVQKKYEEAIREWNKILDIDPYNKLARRNIKEARDRLKKLKELGINE